ncbi:MAG: hypothetical protein AB8B50_14595 [Pirellulaceae bacterium]
MFPDLDQNADLPSPEWLITLDELLCVAESVAEEHGYRMVLERSDRSEARYLHICRNGTWFGIRIATHLPVYACSRDYAQLVTSLEPGPTERRFFMRFIWEKVSHGGRVVANPTQINAYFGLSPEEFRSCDSRRQAQLRHRANRIAAWSSGFQSL